MEQQQQRRQLCLLAGSIRQDKAKFAHRHKQSPDKTKVKVKVKLAEESDETGGAKQAAAAASQNSRPNQQQEDSSAAAKRRPQKRKRPPPAEALGLCKAKAEANKLAQHKQKHRHLHLHLHLNTRPLNRVQPGVCVIVTLLASLVIIFINQQNYSSLQSRFKSTPASQQSDNRFLAGVECAAAAAANSSSNSQLQPQPQPQNTSNNNNNKQPNNSSQSNQRQAGSPNNGANSQQQQQPQATKAKNHASPQSKAANRKQTNATTVRPAKVAKQKNHHNNANLRRTAALAELAEGNSDSAMDLQQQQLQVSITPRVSQIRVPVDSNAILKCLISFSSPPSSSSSGSKPSRFEVHWSRFMYDENVYEQLETSPIDSGGSSWPPDSQQLVAAAAAQGSSGGSSSEDVLTGRAPFDRRQQLRDFLARSRQETNGISELLLEATLSIGPVKAADNASYYCTATELARGAGGGGRASLEQGQARIDLVALSRPVVQLERVQPARDSKSATIHWLVLSDGNTPIKKTILMVRNDSTLRDDQSFGPGSAALPDEASAAAAAAPASGQSSRFASSSVVLDSQYNQWQRIEISDERLADLDSPVIAAGGGGASAEHNNAPYDQQRPALVAQADADVTSLVPQQPGPQSTQQLQQAANGADQTAIGGGGGNGDDYYTSRMRWNLMRAGGGGGRRQRSFRLGQLLPGVTYNFRLAAINDMGQSEWSQLTATMPNEIPAQISEIILVSRSNDSLAIGWKRPAYDNSKTLRYEMQLFDLNRTLTLDAHTNLTTTASGTATNSSAHRTNFMYIFVNLNPGTDYHFHVRACSRAGCSAYSSPKLLASTLDGEPDEPLEVELSCEPESGNVSVSWLPPANPRGQLINYSVTFDSRARYRNESGQWTLDEWRSNMETANNHTLSLEAGSILLPNTNYSVRVCANNRSKRCGKLSQLTGRSQCSTPPELPAGELGPMRLARRQLAPEQGEHLQLELPIISTRNGSLTCIQVVLVRLPGSFGSGSVKMLSQFLPDNPADVTLSRYVAPAEATSTTGAAAAAAAAVDSERALAYLAEELDPNSNSPAPAGQESNQQAAAAPQVSLGDGRHELCKWRQAESIAKPEVFDGPLKARAFYTGFVKLILIRWPLNSMQAQTSNGGAGYGGSKRNAAPEILTKFSGYFEPLQMGDRVVEPEMGDNSVPMMGPPLFADPSKIGQPIQEMADKLSSSLRTNIGKFYNFTSNFVSANVRLESMADFIRQSSPLMQLLEVGVIVIVLSLLLLFIVYLVTLPATIARRRRRKLKRQLQKHQQEAAAAAAAASDQAQLSALAQSGQNSGHNNNDIGNNGANNFAYIQANSPPLAGNVEINSQLQQNFAMPGAAVEYQANGHAYHSPAAAQLHSPALQEQQAAAAAAIRGGECPIHSSPGSNTIVSNIVGNRGGGQRQHEHRQAAVHVCQPMLATDGAHLDLSGAAAGDYQQQQQQQHHSHFHHLHHHHQHSQQQQHQHQSANSINRQQEYERNCRTARRPIKPEQPFGQLPATAAALAGQHQQQAIGGGGGAGNCLTLSQQQSSVLAAAKKINKSIPLRLFRSVLECRLRNGWLKEEYEQLPSPLLPSDPSQKRPPQDGIRLRSQLIVSRNDSMSALISGNDQYDAGLIDFNPPASAAMANQAGGGRGRPRIICARSPLDADSVWDFWRLVYEQDVSTIVMLTQNEDANTGELRCAQYWPTCDNEETTILSPCNEFVQKSQILPAKFKIRQETLEEETAHEGFMVRRLTLMVMASKASENEQQPDQQAVKSSDQLEQSAAAAAASDEAPGKGENSDIGREDGNDDDDGDDDDEKYVIIERDILHLQFHCWNTSNLANQLRLITFIRRAYERHLKSSKDANDDDDDEEVSPHRNANNSMLVHCFNGLGRSGVFATMSFVLDELALKLRFERQQQQLQKINLFQLVSKLRSQREMLLSPYRFYELVYQLTAHCIPAATASQDTTHAPASVARIC